MTPLEEALRIASRAAVAGVACLAVVWAAGNMRSVPPGSQAALLRFGGIVRVQQAGLVLAWPAPLENTVLLPAADRQMVQRIEGLENENFLTGDGGVVNLQAAIVWHVSDAAAYFVARAHVAAALRRLFLHAATVVAARHELDDFLSVRPERATDPAAQAARILLRGEIVADMNANLAGLAAEGAGIGVSCLRADLTATLPPEAKPAFDAVLEAAQRAEQGIAAARTDAARQLQQADRDRDRIFAAAHAAAAERLEHARASTATITALEADKPGSRPAILGELYRTRIAAILHQAGSVSTVDAKSVSRLILP